MALDGRTAIEEPSHARKVIGLMKEKNRTICSRAKANDPSLTTFALLWDHEGDLDFLGDNTYINCVECVSVRGLGCMNFIRYNFNIIQH
jgi:hypothetical protein